MKDSSMTSCWLMECFFCHWSLRIINNRNTGDIFLFFLFLKGLVLDWSVGKNVTTGLKLLHVCELFVRLGLFFCSNSGLNLNSWRNPGNVWFSFQQCFWRLFFDSGHWKEHSAHRPDMNNEEEDFYLRTNKPHVPPVRARPKKLKLTEKIHFLPRLNCCSRSPDDMYWFLLNMWYVNSSDCFIPGALCWTWTELGEHSRPDVHLFVARGCRVS